MLGLVDVSNPNGVNLHQEIRGEDGTRSDVSNPNGVNLHNEKIKAQREYMLFQTPTG